MGRSSIERGVGVDEVLLRHTVVHLDGTFNVIAMNANSNVHERVLRALHNLAIDEEQA